MTTTRTSTFGRRSFRGAALALATGAGIALTPLAASADAGGPVAGASAPVAVAAAPVAAPTHATQVAVGTALAQQGKPYVWGGTGPGGYDCSGLTWSAYQAAGVYVDRASLLPGDLIFFYNPVGHVGMYIGNGQMVHSSTYGQPVKVVAVDSMYGYNTARRVA